MVQVEDCHPGTTPSNVFDTFGGDLPYGRVVGVATKGGQRWAVETIWQGFDTTTTPHTGDASHLANNVAMGISEYTEGEDSCGVACITFSHPDKLRKRNRRHPLARTWRDVSDIRLQSARDSDCNRAQDAPNPMAPPMYATA